MSYQERGRRRRKRINLAIVSANNHYAGFGLGTADIYRKMVGLPEAEWSKEEDHIKYSLIKIQDVWFDG
jgi:hypothetical protein